MSKPDGWTVKTLYSHFNRVLSDLNAYITQRFSDSDKAVQAALQAAKEAVIKAEVAAEKRFDCVSADTPILCADLIWRPAGDLLPGDELIAFDEESPERRGRRFRRSTVVANALRRDTLLTINTPEGSVRCNYDHPWLVQRQYANSVGNWHWVKASDLQAGDIVLHAIDTWEVDRSWDGGWLAGMYDGEGCLCFDKNGSVQLSITQRTSETADRMTAAIKEIVGNVGVYLKAPNTNYNRRQISPQIAAYVNARADVMKVLGSVRPPRLLCRSDEIWEGKPLGSKHRTTTITSVEGSGSGLISELGTSTKTYIAGGFAMHNSQNEFREQLKDQAGTFMPRAEYAIQHQSLVDSTNASIGRLDEKIAANTSVLDHTRGGTTTTQRLVTVLLSVAAILVSSGALIAIILLH